MPNQEKTIVVGKKRSKWRSRIFLTLVYLPFLEWGLLMGWYFGFIFSRDVFPASILAETIRPLHIIAIPLFVFLTTTWYLSVVVRSNGSWSVEETTFRYNDDSKMPMFQKFKAFKSLWKHGYYENNEHIYHYEEISFIRLYYRKHLGYAGALVYPMYFKIYLEDGSILDAPCRLDRDGKKIYEAFKVLEAKGIYIEDESHLLDYLKEDKVFDEKAVGK